ncbi:sulfotransferase [Pleurocapsa sp. PCC 7319]|uniref:sulfotransferase family protein n=1 Tax=Pleurocapsa sp. PCC 7319 TaxID=118161 RepID=UPI00034CB071|nr:sulfotransferase [Pleurocapsa sp. PCC 7319]
MSSKFQNEPFFLVSCPRSGSTMLRLMLNEHPRLRVPDESFFLTELMNKLPLNSPLSQEDKRLAFDIISNHERWANPKFKFRAASNKKLWDTISCLKQPLLSQLIDAVFRNCTHLKNKPRWGDKTPQYISDINRLHQVFPSAKFIHLIRDGRDVCISLRTLYLNNRHKEGHVIRRFLWHAGRTIHSAAKLWHKSVEAGIESGLKLPTESYLEIHYEDLILRTEDTLKNICSFIGENYDDRMLGFYKNSSKETMKEPEAFQPHAKTHRPPTPSDTYRWRTEMNLIEVALFESYAGKTMDRIGQTRHFRGALKFIPYNLRAFDKLRRIFIPTNQDRELLELPDFAYFLYYVLRPIRLLVKYTLITGKRFLPT